MNKPVKNVLKKLGLVTAAGLYLTVTVPQNAHAYIDPSATTYLIQAAAGIAIAVGSVAVIIWRRAKKKLKDKVGIDFDRNKETEEEVVATENSDGKAE